MRYLMVGYQYIMYPMLSMSELVFSDWIMLLIRCGECMVLSPSLCQNLKSQLPFINVIDFYHLLPVQSGQFQNILDTVVRYVQFVVTVTAF
jgi:hypothetical protein